MMILINFMLSNNDADYNKYIRKINMNGNNDDTIIMAMIIIRILVQSTKKLRSTTSKIITKNMIN